MSTVWSISRRRFNKEAKLYKGDIMRQNLTLLTDLYELTMMQGYYKNEARNKMAVFDVFSEKYPSTADTP